MKPRSSSLPPLAVLVSLGALASGCPEPTPSPDGGPPPATGEGTLSVVSGESLTGFSDGKGRAARFSGVTCMELSPDGATLYLADTFNGTVRALDTRDGQVTTLAGAPQQLASSDGSGADARFTSPRGLGLSPDGATLFIADGPTLRRLDVASGEVTLAVGVASEDGFVDGSALEARLGYLLHDLAVSADGETVLIADRSNDVIRAMDVASEAVSTLAGGGASGSDGIGTEAGFNGPGGLALSGGVLYIADTFSHTVRALDLASAAVTTSAGQRGVSGSSDGALLDALLDGPQGIGKAGDVVYATGFDGVLRRIDLVIGQVTTPLGSSAETFALDGDASQARLGGAFAPPVVDEEAGKLYYSDLDAGSVRVIDLADYSVSTLAGPVAPRGLVDGALSAARFGRLYGVAASSDGARVYLADPDNGVVRLVEREHDRVSTLAAEGMTAPVSVVLDEEGARLFVSDAGSGELFVLALADDGTAGETSVLGEPLSTPWGMAYDGEGYLYVADYEGAAIFRVHAESGVRERLAGSGASGSDDGIGAAATFQGPVGLAYETSSRRLFVSDFEASTLRVVDVESGAVSTLAGVAGEPAHKDGTDARLSGPSGLALDGADVVVADTLNHVVRRIDSTSGEARTVLGDVARPGNLGFGGELPTSAATLYEPEALVLTEAGTFIVAEHALFFASGPLAGGQ